MVLIIADSHQRMESLRTATKRLGGGGRFWFASLPHLRAIDAADEAAGPQSADHNGPFWESNWRAAHEDGWRSLAARCGV